MSLILPLAVLIPVMVLVALRKGWIFSGSRFQRAGTFMPHAAPPASRAARWVESLILTLTAVVILAYSATWPSAGGYMLLLDQLRPTYAIANVIMFACAAIGTIVAILIAIRGRTARGAITLAVVLTTYGLVINGGQYPGSWFLPKEMAQPINDYTITLSGCNVEGAELWVNGVFVGKTPYITTLEEFEAKVPYWPKPPADYETDKIEIPRVRPDGISGEIYRRWCEFELPVRSWWPDGSSHGSEPSRERKRYYAKVRYAGEWGFAGGGSGSSGSGGGPTKYVINSHMSVIFPAREKRLEALLNIARLAKYRVASEWFEAIETYQGDGWIALRLAAEKEPQMMEVLDAWANWRYGLDKAIDADSAWRIFQNICDEADARREYCTPGVAGRAIELLMPKLPPTRLLDKAVQLIENADAFGYLLWNNNGKFQFGYTERPDGIFLGSTGAVTMNFQGRRHGSPRFPVRGFPVLHAVWLLNEYLHSTGQPEPNVVQQKIVPAIVCRLANFPMENPMLAAAYFGGSVLDQFLLRQPWQAAPDIAKRDDWIYVSGGQQVNKWLYYLAYLNDDAGRKFRREHADLIMAMADKFRANHFSDLGNLGFIFSDPWLAKEYWPRFARQARQNRHNEPLATQWKYLARMGDAATVEMFVEAWKDTTISLSDNWTAPRVLDELKTPLRRKVTEAVVNQVRKDTHNLDEDVSRSFDRDREISMLESHDGQLESDRVFAELQKGPDPNSGSYGNSLWKNVPRWLAQTQPAPPLVAMLTNAEKPELRLLVIDALREYPIPEHQELLEKLRKDADEAVRTAADKASQELEKLATQKPAAYASDAASASSTVSTVPTSVEMH